MRRWAPFWSEWRSSLTPTRFPMLRTEVDTGVVTLMTLHTAKGLEFDTVFLTGCEDGVFPHQRAIAERTGNELAEERRLAYVGITRARKRLYISRAIARSAWGSPAAQSAKSVPQRGAEPADRLAANRSLPSPAGETRLRPQPTRNGGTAVGYGAKPRTVREIPTLAAGDRVLHTTFGMGTVVATSGDQDKPMADVDFGSLRPQAAVRATCAAGSSTTEFDRAQREPADPRARLTEYSARRSGLTVSGRGALSQGTGLTAL